MNNKMFTVFVDNKTGEEYEFLGTAIQYSEAELLNLEKEHDAYIQQVVEQLIVDGYFEEDWTDYYDATDDEEEEEDEHNDSYDTDNENDTENVCPFAIATKSAKTLLSSNSECKYDTFASQSSVESDEATAMANYVRCPLKEVQLQSNVNDNKTTHQRNCMQSQFNALVTNKCHSSLMTNPVIPLRCIPTIRINASYLVS